VLGYLVARTGVDGRTITIGGPLKDIAAMIGLAPEVLYRTLALLESERIIRRGNGIIELT
jgi:CRP/FNR family transcriptional regulator